jgi:hypothetical protein
MPCLPGTGVVRVHGCFAVFHAHLEQRGIIKKSLAVTGAICAVVRLRGTTAHMLSLCGEVNPRADREFGRKFTVISSLDRIWRSVKQARAGVNFLQNRLKPTM